MDKAITDAIVDFLADSGVAFRVVSLPSFHNLMKIANRRIKLKHPTTYSRLVKTKAEEVQQDVLDIMSAVMAYVSWVVFTADLWTSRSGHPFMSLTVHFSDKDCTGGHRLLLHSLQGIQGFWGCRVAPLTKNVNKTSVILFLS